MNTHSAVVERSSRELVQDALHTEDQEERWQLVRELQRRGSDEEFQLARNLFTGGEEEQVLACEVLGQLGSERRDLGAYPYGAQSVLLLGRALKSKAPCVQAAAIRAAGHLRWETLMESVLALAKSPHALVRQAVAFALGGREDEASLSALLELMRDPDGDVRNWATFGIGTQCVRRDASLRDALAERIHDPHPETRGEAWVGLASKGDLRAFDAVFACLSGDSLEVFAVEAAEAYRDPRFRPLLERWLDECQGPEDELFRDALECALRACSLRS